MINIKDIEERLAAGRRMAEENDAKRRAEHLQLPYLDLISIKVPTEIKAMALVPEAEALKALLCPLQLVKTKLMMAVFDPEKPEARAIITKLKEKYELGLVVSSLTSLKHAWSYYKYVLAAASEITGEVDVSEDHLQKIKSAVKTLNDFAALLEDANGQLTSQILEAILGGAIALRASDIHLEPGSELGSLRFRIDGLLHAAYEKFLPKQFNSIITRIKLLSQLKLNITDQAQDGRFTINLENRDIEIRVSIIPSEYGETTVMRLLDPLALKVNLEELGWREDDLEIIKKTLKRPNGLILNTGPTGSGKTTTLYAFLKYAIRPEIKIITVEDPIEYHLAGISQTQVDPEAGYTFASGLRSILRQDPNIILVGEIRDKETAEISMNAALTGHVVFSTLHTNDAIGAIPRLIDLGIATQILGSATSLIIAQRLVRVLCPHCKTLKNINAEETGKIEKFLSTLSARINKENYKEIKIYEPAGCEQCGGLGYHGRMSIFELFLKTDGIEKIIYQSPTEMDLFKLARAEGMVTMQEDGILKVIKGVTSLAEVERLTGPVKWTQ